MVHKFIFGFLLATVWALASNSAGAQDRSRKADGKDDAAGGAKVEVTTSVRSSQIVGMRVRNKANKDVGAIDDLVVGLGSGKIRYAALSFGGFAGLGNKLFAVPWEALTYKFGEKDRYLVFDVAEDDLKNAPGFDKTHWPNVADPAWASGIDKYYKIVRTSVTPGEKPAGGNVVYDDAYRVSTLKGMKVRNDAGKDLGSIDEVVFDLKEGRINYAALSYGSVVGIGGKLFAIPFDAFKLHQSPSDKYLVLNVTEDKLRDAPGFDSNVWPNTADGNWSREIDRYYGENQPRKN